MVRSSGSDSRHDVLEEHRRLVGRLQELEAWLDRVEHSPAWADQLRVMLLDVVERLREHFGGEAEGKMFESLLHDHPRFSPQITKLVAEHPRIVQLFATAAERAVPTDASSRPENGALVTQVQRALATLRRHEAEENELIMNAYWDDLGGQG